MEEKYRVYKERLEKALALAQGKTPAEESVGEEIPPTENCFPEDKKLSDNVPFSEQKPSEEKPESEQENGGLYGESVC